MHSGKKTVTHWIMHIISTCTLLGMQQAHWAKMAEVIEILCPQSCWFVLAAGPGSMSQDWSDKGSPHISVSYSAYN